MDLLDFSFLGLLPDSITADPRVVAAADLVEEQLTAVSRVIRNVEIWARLDEIGEPLLSTLAWALHVDDFEGWALAENEAQKRRLIRESLIIHRYKGTRWSLARLFTLLDMRGYVQEWFEYGGQPYLFRVDLYLTRSVDGTLAENVLALIDALKNVRSHLDRLRIILETRGTLFAGAACLSGTRTVLRPRPLGDLVGFAPVYAGGAFHVVNRTILFPA